MPPLTVQSFHRRCGCRVTLTQNSTTALRNPADFNCGLVLSAQPLVHDQVFEVRIDKKVSCSNQLKEVKFIFAYIIQNESSLSITH